MCVLLTGFQPFGNLQINPSQCIIEHFQNQKRADLILMVLPTEYQASGACIEAAIRSVEPDAIISLGVAQSRSAMNLERVTLNLDDASIADNAGLLASGQPIAPGAPTAYLSTLPLDAMKAALEAAGIPVVISNYAGTYVCNHVFYSARHALEASGMTIPCGFIHVPDLLKTDDKTTQGLALETMVEAVEICLQVLNTHASAAPAYQQESLSS